MDVSAADMADGRDDEAGGCDVGSSFGDTAGKGGDGHADIGGSDRCLESHRLHRIMDVVAGALQAVAGVGVRCGLEGDAAVLDGDILGQPPARPVRRASRETRGTASAPRVGRHWSSG